MLDIINRYLTSLGLKSVMIVDYEEILGHLAEGRLVAAVKHLREVSRSQATHFFQSRQGSSFVSYLIANNLDYLTLDVKTLGLKDAKEICDFISDNWAVRYAEE